MKLADLARVGRVIQSCVITAVDTRSATDLLFVCEAIRTCFEDAKAAGLISQSNPLRLTSQTSPLDSPDIKAALADLADRGSVLVLLFDQFEELFAKEELFETFSLVRRLSFAVDAERSPLILGFAWKTDISLPQQHPAYYLWHQLANRRKPKGIDEVFARYPNRREARPKHLSDDVLKAVLSAAGSRRRLYLMLMLNTGMQPTDIPQVTHDAFDRDRSTVRWQRQKNQRMKNPFDQEIISYLWPETMELVVKFLSDEPGPAFLTVDGKSLYHESASQNRQNAVTKSLAKFFGKIERDKSIEVSAKNFRQTGAQAIHEVTEDYSLSQIWLGRGFKKVDRPYLKEMYGNLHKASLAVRDRLVIFGVLPLPPAKDRNYGD